MKNRNWVYISGPISKDPDYMDKFIRAEQEIKDLFGQDVGIINPARIFDSMPEDMTHEEYMYLSFRLLDMPDVNMIYMLEGWEESSGACQEYGYAMRMSDYGDDMVIIRQKRKEMA